MHLNRLILLLLIAFSTGGSALLAQAGPDCVYLWNGFSQHWGYNHRLNRLGDHIEVSPDIDQDCHADLVHAAASGSGADQANFTSHFSQVKIKDLQAIPFSCTLVLDGREGILLEAETTLRIPNLDSRQPSWAAAAVLNGFDLRTAEGAKADKIEHFFLALDSLQIDSASGLVEVPVRAEVRMSCSSPECEFFKNDVHYELVVHGLLLAGPMLQADHERIGRGLSWTRDSLPDPAPVTASILGQSGFSAAALGLSSLRLSLDKEHHFADWAMCVQPGDYEASSGRYTYAAGLYFGQWKPEQYDAFEKYYTGKPRIPARWAVQRKPGSAILEMEVVLLQFKAAEVVAGSASGQIHWQTRPGRQVEAGDSLGISRLRQ